MRDRREDLPLLAQHFLRAHAQRYRKRLTGFESGAMQMLLEHSWPGNVRELKNNLAFALAFLDGPVLEARHLSVPPVPEAKSDLAQLPLGGIKLENIERVAIEQTLGQTRGNKARAAQILRLAGGG